jgi:hypothetical protein
VDGGEDAVEEIARDRYSSELKGAIVVFMPRVMIASLRFLVAHRR